MTKFIKLSAFVITLSLLSISCSKDGEAGKNGLDGTNGTNGAAGPNGPQGPQGPNGPQGPQGPQGPSGTNGTNGNANVIYSPWIALTFFGSGASWATNTPAPQITQTVLDQALIMAYVKASNGTVFPLAYNDGNLFILSKFIVGYMILNANYNATGDQFRYVIVPGSTPATRMSNGEKRVNINGNFFTESDFKNMPYKEVCQLLQIRE